MCACCAPRGGRIPVTALKGRRPRPLDDGGSAPLETSIVAAGCPFRTGRHTTARPPVATVDGVRRGVEFGLLVLVALSLCACSSSAGRDKTTQPKQSPCPLVARLDQTAAMVARADVRDPDAFKRTLDDAVNRYVATVRELKRVTPSDLKPDLDRMEAAVHQYRFQEAATARASIDTYAATTCGRTPPSTGTRTPSTTTG